MITFARWVARGVMGRVETHPDFSTYERAVALVVLFMACVIGTVMFLDAGLVYLHKGWRSHWLDVILDVVVAWVAALLVGAFGEMLVLRLTAAAKDRQDVERGEL